MLRAVTAMAVVLGWSTAAFAFQIESPVSGACHENITLTAADRAGYPDGTLAPAPSDEQARALADLTFSLPATHRDVWSLALMFGVRSNDVRDNALTDFASLVHIHDDPADQPAHCLRLPQHDGSDGNAQALATCREFILAELEVGGLFEDTIPTAAEESVGVFLAFRGRVKLMLPRFAYHLGRALHALEDAHSHTFRNPATGEVRTVLNWVDSVDPDDYEPARDGEPHMSLLDDCRRGTATEERHVELATDAATALLEAIGNPAGGGVARRVRVEAALARALALQPGCDASNAYCDAPELKETAVGCSIAGAPGLVCVLAVVLLARRRRPLVIALLLFAVPARAEKVAGARVGASLDRAAASFSATGGIIRDDHIFTAVLEWNPWFSLDAGTAAKGTLNFYATFARRWFHNETFELTSRVEAGTSIMLFELVGVDRYQTGIYLGAGLLGIAFKYGEHWRWTIDPSHFALPIPQVTGVPFYYAQHRVSTAIEYRW